MNTLYVYRITLSDIIKNIKYINVYASFVIYHHFVYIVFSRRYTANRDFSYVFQIEYVPIYLSRPTCRYMSISIRMMNENEKITWRRFVCLTFWVYMWKIKCNLIHFLREKETKYTLKLWKKAVNYGYVEWECSRNSRLIPIWTQSPKREFFSCIRDDEHHTSHPLVWKWVKHATVIYLLVVLLFDFVKRSNR